jgi:hypothetical protein
MTFPSQMLSTGITRAASRSHAGLPVPTPYAVNGLSLKAALEVNNALQRRTDLGVERVDVLRLTAGSMSHAFLLVDDDNEIIPPATPFASPEWESHIVRGLSANAVLVPVTGFLEAARQSRLASLHAHLWGRQFFHRATAALATRRRPSQWGLSMRGLVVRVPVTTSDDLALARQCREADLRVEPFSGSGDTFAHLQIEPRAKARRLRMPAIALETLEALRPMTSGERRSAFSELFIEAIAPYRLPPY